MAQPSARAKPGPTVRDNPYLALPPDLRGLAQRMDLGSGARGARRPAREKRLWPIPAGTAAGPRVLNEFKPLHRHATGTVFRGAAD